MNIKNNKFQIIEKELLFKTKPIVLELGVNKGRSTSQFLKILKKNDGELYSVDINDCSKVISDNTWNFCQSNDLNICFILNKFSKLKNLGIDLLFIDSYHDPNHVLKILEKYWIYLNKECCIFFDDTESYLYRIKKQRILSMVNDSVDNEIKEFYYSNYDDIVYTKYFTGSGLSKFKKISPLGTAPNLERVWKYNFIFYLIYFFLKKILFFFRNK